MNLNSPTRSNCLFWAINTWLHYGGYIRCRRSHNIRLLPHFIWSIDKIEWYGYSPIKPTRKWWRLYWILFKGYIEKE